MILLVHYVFASCGLEKHDCLLEITTKEGQQQP